MKDGSIWEFDVDAWRADEALSLLRPASRDFWHEALMVMWKSGQRGELKGSLDDLRRLCRCSLIEARAAIDEIKARNVAEVHESNGVVTLINRRMRREYMNRASVAFRVAKSRAKSAGRPFPFEDVTAWVTRLSQSAEGESVTAGVSLAASSPPGPLSPTPLPSRVPDAAHPGGGVASAGGKKSERKLTNEQNEVWREFRDWWTNVAWPKRHQGELYPFGDRERGHGADGPKSIQICRKGGWDLAAIKRVAEAFLDEPEMYGNYDHKLSRLDQKFNSLRRHCERGGATGDHRKKGASHGTDNGSRGAFTGARRSLPDVAAS